MKNTYNKLEIQKLFKGKEIITVSHKGPRDPSMLYISLDERCNENCVFCVIKGDNVGTFGSMSLKEAKKIISQFLNKGGKDLVFTGGEPTLREDLPILIKYAETFKSLKNISVITNGVRLGDKKYLDQISKSDKKKLVSFSISLHSHKEKVSELLTQSKGTYKCTIQGIRNAIKSNYEISIYQVITSENYKDLLTFCKFLNKFFPQINRITLA